MGKKTFRTLTFVLCGALSLASTNLTWATRTTDPHACRKAFLQTYIGCAQNCNAGSEFKDDFRSCVTNCKQTEFNGYEKCPNPN